MFGMQKRRRVADLRLRMIDETSQFLTWALADGRDPPRIPTRPVEHGGFEAMMRRPGAREAAGRLWLRALDRLGLG